MPDFNDPKPIATAEQFRAALLAVRQRMSDVHLQMLQIHCRAEGHSISTDRIAEAMGLSKPIGAKSSYGHYAHMLADELKFVPGMVGKKPMWLQVLAYGLPDATGKVDGGYVWIMRPELVEPLQAMKWA